MYYPIKTIFLLYLALPQTRGSSYLYVFHLQPFFHSHEDQIDAALASFKTRVYTFFQERFRALWDQITASIGQQQQPPTFDPAGGVSSANTGSPPSLANPISGPVQLASTFWASYGPAILASGTALLRQTQAAATSSATANSQALNSPTRTPPVRPSHARQPSAQTVADRRRQLEAELAALAAESAGSGSEAPLTPAAGPSFAQGQAPASGSNLRERSASGLKFEEVEVPSDTEGYELGGANEGVGSESDASAGRPFAIKRGSWFGWAGASAAKGGYERVKGE